MIDTVRKPDSVGAILREEFMEPLGITQDALAQAAGLPRKHINELCNDRRAVTIDTALILARSLGTSAEFWMNTQLRNDRWKALNDPERASRINRAVPVIHAHHS